MNAYIEDKIWIKNDLKMQTFLTRVWAVSLVIAITIALVTLIG